MKIQKNIDLKKFCTFRVGGPARYFASAQAVHEIQEALSWAHTNGQPTFIIGGGSNILFPDEGFSGLVIKPSFMNCAITGTHVQVGASLELKELIARSLAEGLVGMEFAAGIPGSVGGAIRGNAGTYGLGMSDIVETVTVLDTESRATQTLTNAECVFAYRHSVFKLKSLLIVEASLALSFGDVIASKKLIEERIETRKRNHPTEPSAGCIFKNLEFAKVPLETLRRQGVAIEQFAQHQKIPTGYLIEQLGLKGKRIGGAQISEKHANYIINTGHASYDDVMTLISYIKQQVRDTYGIQLEEEIQVVSPER